MARKGPTVCRFSAVASVAWCADDFGDIYLRYAAGGCSRLDSGADEFVRTKTACVACAQLHRSCARNTAVDSALFDFLWLAEHRNQVESAGGCNRRSGSELRRIRS